MGVSNVPQIILLKPELEKYFAMWTFAQGQKTYAGVMNFVQRDYEKAFTQGALPVQNFEELTFAEKMSINFEEFNQVMLEELYSIFLDVGMASDPTEDY